PLSIHHASFYATICMPNENIQWKPFCYNLRSWEAQEPVPPEVAKRKDAENKCEGIVNCIMNVRYVAFDLVTEVFDEEKGAMTRMKQIIQMKFSSDVPLLSRLLSVCYQGIGTYKKQPYVATICTDVMDFERENPPPPTP